MKKQLILCCALALSSINAQEITKENWISHPKIKEIRKIFQTINDSNLIKIKSKKCEFDGGVRSFTATLYIDSDYRIRKYIFKGGSDDSVINNEYYYSVTGKNRFTFRRLGAINGTRLEQRIYFSEEGQKLYEDYRLLAGPGYPFGSEDKYIPDPERDFLTFCSE